MSNLNASTRLKVNRDTFFIPDANGNVYFRNNLSSFQMEGNSIYQWIEKLMPMFNGEHSLGSLTDGLPVQYRDRVHEIGEILLKNGFVRDVSQDRPHQLTENILENYGSQIEFLNSFGDSGAFRFQTYRQAKVLGIGSGSFIVSLVSALLESGLAKFHLLITDIEKTNRKRINELIKNARKIDSEVEVELIKKERRSWRKIIEPYDSILYVSEENNVEEIRRLNSICKEEKKRFIPALCTNQIALAGPLVSSDKNGCFESAWRSIHSNEFLTEEQLQPFSSVTSAMLSNVVAFELFKDITKSSELEKSNQFFLINQESLEGNWHTFMPHPLVTGSLKTEFVQDFDQRLEQNDKKSDQANLLHYVSGLTSEVSGVFHIWDEGNLKQLPLAQCRIQVVDPLTQGPVKLLPRTICTALTHEEARKEAALTGIEMYTSQLAGVLVKNKVSIPSSSENSLLEQQEFFTIGTGETFAECICRALQKYLSNELLKQNSKKVSSLLVIKSDAIEDEQCQFYLQSLKIMAGVPKIGLGKDIFGFPVVWVGTTNGNWYRSVGLNRTMALRKALQQALMEAQNKATDYQSKALNLTSVLIEEKNSPDLTIPEWNDKEKADLLMSAIKILKQNNKQLIPMEFMLEQFKTEELAGVYGVLLREV